MTTQWKLIRLFELSQLFQTYWHRFIKTNKIDYSSKNYQNPLFVQQEKAKWIKILESITKIQNVLKIWQMHRLTLEGKIIVFKTLERNSKIIFHSLISKVPTEIISELERIQKTFLWPSKRKIKNETLCSDFKYGGLKNVNIQKKNNIQCSWVRRLHGDSFHEWKVILMKLIKKILWITF